MSVEELVQELVHRPRIDYQRFDGNAHNGVGANSPALEFDIEYETLVLMMASVAEEVATMGEHALREPSKASTSRSTTSRPGSAAFPERWVAVGPADLLRGRSPVVVTRDGEEVVVVRTRRGLFAFENRCPHSGISLADAVVSGSDIVCRDHGRRYSMATGLPSDPSVEPASQLRTFHAFVMLECLWISAPTGTATAGAVGE